MPLTTLSLPSYSKKKSSLLPSELCIFYGVLPQLAYILYMGGGVQGVERDMIRKNSGMSSVEVT